MSMQIRPYLLVTPLTRQCRDLMRDSLRAQVRDMELAASAEFIDPQSREACRSKQEALTEAADRLGECVGIALKTHNPSAQPRDLADLVMQEALMLRQSVDAHDHDVTASALVTLRHLVTCLQRERMSPHEQEVLCPEWDYSRNGRLHWINHHERAEEV